MIHIMLILMYCKEICYMLGTNSELRHSMLQKKIQHDKEKLKTKINIVRYSQVSSKSQPIDDLSQKKMLFQLLEYILFFSSILAYY